MKMRRRNPKMPCPFKVGDRNRPIAMFEHHACRRGGSYEVVEIDPDDSTLKARDEHGQTGARIRWRDCEKFNEIGWERLKGQLSAESLELLAAFDGLANPRLRDDVEIRGITSIPRLAEAIFEVLPAIEDERERLANAPPEEEDDFSAFENITLQHSAIAGLRIAEPCLTSQDGRD